MAKRFIRARKWRLMSPPSSKKYANVPGKPWYRILSGIETDNLFVVNENPSVWRITHKASGRSVGKFIAPMKDVYALLDEFETLGNWSLLNPDVIENGKRSLSRAIADFSNTVQGQYWRT